MIPEEPDVDAFLYALAAAVLAWQPVEKTLFLIFNFLVGPHKNPNVLSSVYHSVVNLNIRLTMIDGAAAVVLKGDPYLAEWEKLSKRVTKAAKNRNILVHFGLVRHKHSKGKPDSLRLEPSAYDVTEEPGLQYDLKQIREWHDSFIILWRDLNAFLDHLPPSLRSSP